MNIDVGEGCTCSSWRAIQMPEGATFDVDIGGGGIEAGVPRLSTDLDITPASQGLTEFEFGAGSEQGGKHGAPFCPGKRAGCFLEWPMESRIALDG